MALHYEAPHLTLGIFELGEQRTVGDTSCVAMRSRELSRIAANQAAISWALPAQGTKPA
jgi:hypothetical protein